MSCNTKEKFSDRKSISLSTTALCEILLAFILNGAAQIL